MSEEVQRNERDRGRRSRQHGTAGNNASRDGSTVVNGDNALHAGTDSGGRIVAEADAADLREAAIACASIGHAVLQNRLQSRWRGVAEHEAVVEAHRVFDVEQRNGSGGLPSGWIGQRRQFGSTTHFDGSDGGADATTVLQRGDVRGGREGRFTHGDHRVGADVAEIGLLIAHKAAFAFEINVGEATDITVLRGDDALHGVGDLLHESALGACGEGCGRKIDFRHIPGGGDV